MILDTSALMAVILKEDDEEPLLSAMVDADFLRMSSATWLESAIVVDGRSDDRIRSRFEELMIELDVEVVPLTLDTAKGARQAYREFGRGNHPAKLNFGDCFAYALAKDRREPLLYKGDDFRQTDIDSAI